MVLPVFVTGRKPQLPPARQAVADTKLPPSERGMLVFVAALLALGTIAVVIIMGLNLTGGKSAKHHPSTVVSTPRSDDPSASSAASNATPDSDKVPVPAKRKATPARRKLGALTAGDPSAYCTSLGKGFAVPPGRDNPHWRCRPFGRQDKAVTFTPNDVCQWRYTDDSAYATVGDPTDAATWRCFT